MTTIVYVGSMIVTPDSDDQFLDHLLPVGQQINLVWSPISRAKIIGHRIRSIGQIDFERGAIRIPDEISGL